VQQLLAAIWYDGLPGFRRKTMLGQLMQVGQLGCMFPLYSSIYMMAPESDTAKFMKKPFVKFISHSASYFMFLSMTDSHSKDSLLIMASFFSSVPGRCLATRGSTSPVPGRTFSEHAFSVGNPSRLEAS
jgi:hypothetical protein